MYIVCPPIEGYTTRRETTNYTSNDELLGEV
jgi:hypothetical protein